MLTRKCSQCGVEMPLDKNNSTGIVLYNQKYYHKECFCNMITQKMKESKKPSALQNTLNKLEQYQTSATEKIRLAVAKDDIYWFIMKQYRLSSFSNLQFKQLDEIYSGKRKGLAYPIGPEELLDEWKYYWDYLLSSTQFKNMTSSQMLSYHMSVLLSRNAEYREEIARKNVEEQVRAAQRETEVEIDKEAMTMLQGNTKRIAENQRRADLFKEVMGDGN